MNTAIRFLRFDPRYRRPAGYIDRQMGYGIHQMLVQRGVAEFVDETASAAPISEPSRDRKPRRSSKEPKE